MKAKSQIRQNRIAVSRWIWITVVGFLLPVFYAPLASYAQVPQSISYQGNVLEDGVSFSGYRTITLSLWANDVGGDPNNGLWYESQNVEVIDGIYNVELGLLSPLPSDLYTYSDLFLQVDILHPTEGMQRLSPLMALNSTVFALKAANADDADTVDGMHAEDLDQSAHVTDTGNPHNVTATQIGAITTESDPTVPASIKDGITWTEVDNRPTGLDDGDDVGIEEELDPTVETWIKDGITWTEVDNRPAGLDDGDDVGITSETDPQVGSNTTSYVPRWNGSALVAGSVYDDGANVAIGTTTPENAGLTVESAVVQYGAIVTNQGGYSGDTYGINSISLSDEYNVIGFKGKAQSSGSEAFGIGILLDVDTTGSAPGLGFYADVDQSGTGDSIGAQLITDSTTGSASGLTTYTTVNSSASTAMACGVYSHVVNYGSGSLADAQGSWIHASHQGTEGTAFGQYIYSEGSVTGDSYGVYSHSHKASLDTAGAAYGGYFRGDNNWSGGTSYGLYTEATGANSTHYGVYSRTASSSGISYGFYADVYTNNLESYGAYIDAAAGSSATGKIYGLYSNISHAGTSGLVYGVRSIAYSSDTSSCYGGHFRAYSNPGDSGNIYGVDGVVDNNTSGNKYAGNFYKIGGGDYAGYFIGNVNIIGTMTATSKSFIQPHKTDASKEIVYVSMEGPEHTVFIRGTATLEDGVAYIEMPEYWTQVAADEGITVNLTPEGQWAPLFVASKSKEEIVVEVAEGGPLDAAFSYTVMALRDGFQDHEPIQENTHFTADGASSWLFENQFTEDTPDNIAIREMLMANGIFNSDGRLNAQAAQALGWKITPNEKDPHYRQAHGMEPLDDDPGQESEHPRPVHVSPEHEPNPGASPRQG